MGIQKVDHTTPSSRLKDKHLVFNCSTGDMFAADTHGEAQALAAKHEEEAEQARIFAEEEARRGNR